MLTTDDYLNGLHCLHEAQKVNATLEESIFKLRLYLEDKVGDQHILNTILTLIKTKQIIDFTNNKQFEYCTSLLPLFMIMTSPSISISIKYGNTTYHMYLDDQLTSSKSDQFDMIANHIRIPSDRLKLIYKGKQYTKENWYNLSLTSNMTFLAIGEQNEDETDINTKDIECVMRQMKVDRNIAVKALKLHSNTIDAILYLGNK